MDMPRIPENAVLKPDGKGHFIGDMDATLNLNSEFQLDRHAIAGYMMLCIWKEHADGFANGKMGHFPCSEMDEWLAWAWVTPADTNDAAKESLSNAKTIDELHARPTIQKDKDYKFLTALAEMNDLPIGTTKISKHYTYMFIDGGWVRVGDKVLWVDPIRGKRTGPYIIEGFEENNDGVSIIRLDMGGWVLPNRARVHTLSRSEDVEVSEPEKVQAIEVKPGGVVVLEHPGALPRLTMDRIKERAKRQYGMDVMILTEGLTLKGVLNPAK